MMFYIWIGAVICLTIYFKGNMTRNQQKQIDSTIFIDEKIVDGKKKKIQRIKCPNCGNKELNYQMVNSGAVTRSYKNGKLSATSVSSSKHALCNKCGTSFQVIRRTTPFINGVFAFLFSCIVCSVGEIAIGLILSLFGIK